VPTDRYARQSRLPEIGPEGTAALRAGRVLVVGCGALGSVASELLARAGVGTLAIVDRDTVEASNLSRQFLFDETDARRGVPKAEAAKARLAKVNAEVRVRAFVDDLGPANVRRYLSEVDLVVDGLDNLETRYLLNDAAVEAGIPYVYGAAVGTAGMFGTILPKPRAGLAPRRIRWPASRATPCLRCLFPDLPPPGSLPTCESAGVLGPATATIASFEAAEAIKLLVGDFAAVERGLVEIDLWRGRFVRRERGDAFDPDCPACGRGEFPSLRASAAPRAAPLCGRNATRLETGRAPDLDAVLARLQPFGSFVRLDGRVEGRFAPEVAAEFGSESEAGLTVFADGAIVVRGTDDPERARSLVARFVGT